MKTPLAWCNLCQDKLRTLVATGGVAFALTLVFMELGFLGSVTNTASLVLDQFDFDIAIVARGYRNLIDAGTFPRLRLYEAQSVPGVARTTPLYVGVQGWRSERDRPEDHHFHLGKRRPILVLGFPPGINRSGSRSTAGRFQSRSCTRTWPASGGWTRCC